MTVHDLRTDQGRTYRYYNQPVLAPFGFGLSYTNWSLSAQWPASSSMPIAQPNTSASLTISLKNTGVAESSEVVMAYFRPSQQVLTSMWENEEGQMQQNGKLPLIKQLFAIERLPVVATGESQAAEFKFSPRQLALTDPANGNSVLVPGTYNLEFTTGRPGKSETVSWEVRLTGTKAVLDPFP
jgi:beta-glucosidase